MLRKIAFGVMVAIAGACTLGACAGPGGQGEGDSCSDSQGCSADLTCQPISGRPVDYCCPTPAEQSDKSTCHADVDGG
jgi:hypothetical protein